jgi:hypothetical protein
MGTGNRRNERREEACGEQALPEPWLAWWKACSWVSLEDDDHTDDHPCGKGDGHEGGGKGDLGGSAGPLPIGRSQESGFSCLVAASSSEREREIEKQRELRRERKTAGMEEGVPVG